MRNPDVFYTESHLVFQVTSRLSGEIAQWTYEKFRVGSYYTEQERYVIYNYLYGLAPIPFTTPPFSLMESLLAESYKALLT